MEPYKTPNAKEQQQQPLKLASSTTSQRPAGEPDTPSSTIAEFGDAVEAGGPPSVFESIRHLIQSSHRSRIDCILNSLATTLLQEGWDKRMIEPVIGGLRRGIFPPIENEEDGSDAPAHHDGVAPMADEPSSGGWDAVKLVRERQLYRRIITLLVSDGEIVVEARALERDSVLASPTGRVHYEAAARGESAAAAAYQKDEEEGSAPSA